jgi:hypothetical protein
MCEAVERIHTADDNILDSLVEKRSSKKTRFVGFFCHHHHLVPQLMTLEKKFRKKKTLMLKNLLSALIFRIFG